MNPWRWRSFERVVRRRVRRRLRELPALKRKRKKRPTLISKTISVLFVSAMAGMLLTRATQLKGGYSVGDWPAALLALLLTAVAIFIGSALGRLPQSVESFQAAFFPMESERLWRYLLRRFFARMLILIVILWPTYWAVSLNGLTSLLVVLMQVAGVGLLALLVWPAGKVIGRVALACFAVAVTGLIWGGELERLVAFALWMTPAGWVNRFFVEAVLEGRSSGWLWLVPLGGLMPLVPICYRRLRARFVIADLVTFQNVAAAFVEATRAISPAEIAAMQELVRGRKWFEMGEPQDWLDRFIWQRLSPRERLVADFMLAGQWGFVRRVAVRLKVGCALLIAGVLLCWVNVVIGIIVGLISVLVLLPVLGGGWENVAGVAMGRHTPLYGLLPIRIWEVLRVSMKMNAATIWLTAPVLLVGGVGLGWATGEGAGFGLLIAFRTVLLAVACHPLGLIFQYTGNTNDTREGSRVKLRLMLLLIVSVFVDLGLGITGIFAPGLIAVWTSMGLLTYNSLAAFIYFRWHERSRYDLVA